MLTIRESQLQQMASATPGQPVVKPCTRSWIEIRLVDDDNRPVPGQKYRVKLPDATTVTGVLDGEGKARINGITPGQSVVCFPDIDAKEWQQV